MISIVVPIYNVESFLQDCLDSIVLQTYKNYEVILVNDGSNDQSLAIAQRYVASDSRFHIISQKNAGLSAARNAAIPYIKGEYVTFVDSDDKLHPKFLEICISYMSEDVDAVETGRNYITEDSIGESNKILRLYPESSEISYYTGANEMIAAISQGKLYQSVFPRLLRSNLITPNFFPRGLIFEDLASTPQLHMRMRKVVKVHKALFYYRVRKNSITTKTFTEKNLDLFKVCDLVEKDFLSQQNTSVLPDVYFLLCKNILFQYNLYMTWKNPYRVRYEEYLRKYLPHLNDYSNSDINLFKTFPKFFYILFRIKKYMESAKQKIQSQFWKKESE